MFPSTKTIKLNAEQLILYVMPYDTKLEKEQHQ